MWPETPPVRFIIWGHEHYSHTHSYIHYGFFKAAKHMGWTVEWFKNTQENASKLGNTDGCLFLTESQVDSFIPVNPMAFYVLHNCDMKKYDIIPLKNKLILQVFTKDVYPRKTVPVKNNLFEFWQEDANTLYAPWATDLLPHEIDKNISTLQLQKNNNAVFVGSYWGGVHGNNKELVKFHEACIDNNIDFKVFSNIDQLNSISLIQDADIAPTIVGTWQKEKGYIPCRIFKNVSYGKLGVTNSKEAYEAINKLGVYNQDESQLVKDAIDNNDLEVTKKAMEFVRDNHTYINRIDTLQYIFQTKQI